jgi:cell division septum initiation protein DivIVA
VDEEIVNIQPQELLDNDHYLRDAISDLEQDLSSHTHSKSDVGLGNVQNYGIATQAQAQAGTANNVYMTPLRVAEAISSLTPVKSVAGKTGAVTLSKSDVGLGNVQNYGIATQAQAEAGTANNVYMTPLRVKEAITALAPLVPLQAVTSDPSNPAVGRIWLRTDLV